MRINALSRNVILGMALVATLSAQTPVLMGAGYTSPAPMSVAPGQVVTLYVSGTPTVLPSQSPSIQATTLPLPTTLGPFSVTVKQGNNTFAAPLFSVAQTSNCQGTPSPQCIITALMVQIPFEIVGGIIPEVGGTPATSLSVSDSGTLSSGFPAVSVLDNIHVVTFCDKGGVYPFPSPCPALATHADGSVVTQSSPAIAGETVVLYAYGLGLTVPAVPSGVATPTPAPYVVQAFSVQFDFRPNAMASVPYVNPPISKTNPTPIRFAGLTPGGVGLYQINVKLPATVPSVPPCNYEAFECLNSLIGCVILSNLTIDIAGVSSLDGAAICVQPSQ